MPPVVGATLDGAPDVETGAALDSASDVVTGAPLEGALVIWRDGAEIDFGDATGGDEGALAHDVGPYILYTDVVPAGQGKHSASPATFA